MACGCNQGTNEINTLTCDNSSPCSPSINSNVCGCGCRPCQCSTAQTAAPTPYYNCGTAVQETHCQTIVQQNFVTSITTSSAFNVPACQATATITLPGLTKILVGSYLWHPIYGYFEVVSFDYLSHQVVIRNSCISNCVPGEPDFASPGTSVPACTQFTVTDAPCGGAGADQFGVFVAIDFIAPAIGNCLDIAVTSTVGLYAGLIVQIGSGQYRISAIAAGNIITICNDGSGITPGTFVDAIDSGGNYLYPVTPSASNACANTPNATGSLLSCHNNIQAPLDGTAIGQIPVLIDPATNEVQFQSLDLPTAICTTMTSCLNLLNGVNTYVIVVDDSGIFTVGDIVIIHDPLTETFRWEVTNIVDPTHVEITLVTPAPPNTLVAEVGCNNVAICLAPCCEQLQAGTQICDYDWSSAFKTTVQQDEGDGAVDTITPITIITGTTESLVIENDTCNPMTVFITWHTSFYHIFTLLTGTIASVITARVGYLASAGLDEVAIGAAFPPVSWAYNYTQVPLHDYPMLSSDDDFYAGHQVSKSEIYTIAAGNKINVYTRGVLTYLSNNVAPNTNLPLYGVVTSDVHAIAVAVQAA